MNKVFGGILLGAFLIGIVLVLWQKGTVSKQPPPSDTIGVSASIYPLSYFASQIGSDKATVHTLTPAGSEPHNYEPTAQDITRIESGTILIVNGVVEPWIDAMRTNLKGRSVTFVVAGEGLLTQKTTDDGNVSLDPHIWLDPVLAKKESEKILEAFIAVDPPNATFYKQNETDLVKRFDTLDDEYKKGLVTCQSRDIITSHAAFAYLAKQYGLHQVPISGLSPDAEPSARQLATIVTFAKAHNIHTIFFEQLVSPRLAETIAREVGARTMVLDPLEGLSDDRITRGENYFTVMQTNLKSLREALQCN